MVCSFSSTIPAEILFAVLNKSFNLINGAYQCTAEQVFYFIILMMCHNIAVNGGK